MTTRIARWGNSLGVRIPTTLTTKCGITDGSSVEIDIENGAIVIRPRRHTLDSLLAGVTPDNRHAEVSTGTPIGREQW